MVIQKMLLIVEKLAGSQISNIDFSSHYNTYWFEVQFWDRPSIFEWEEYKSCNYKDQLTDWIKITYWDIEEDFNTMEGKSYE